jgi:hypothetical protein
MLKSSVPVLVLFSQIVLFSVTFMGEMSSGDCLNRFSASLYNFMFLAILLTDEVKPLDDM